MPKKPDWEKIRQEWEANGITLKALAEKHGVKLGTLKSRKSREKWTKDATKKDAAKGKVVASTKKTRYPNGHPGNKNPKNQFTKRNQAAKKHGFFSKYIPKETLEIMGTMAKEDPADIIWDQIIIQYAAIIRAQSIMFVTDKDEMIKELKKEKESWGNGSGSSETEWEFQFAWERQAQFLNAQSRAMSELRSLIKQFNEMATDNDERRLKLQLMQANIKKAEAEAEKLANDDSNKAPPVINIVPLERKKHE